uniref:CCR4-NOT transcription complex subunit 4 n=1 Tax=Globodera pallida TaxID=36090 RepID=A0A183BPC7_GLOPA
MSSDDQSDKECPLCMEAFDIDDINFYPCNCQYQICRFCWHRIRTNENGLCPACRQSYPEDPVNFQPLSSADVRKIKSDKKQKVQQQKNKVVESRKHLAEFRVLQKNLVYAVGLSQRMADPELLKKHEFFGKFGKIIKIAVGAAPALNSIQPAVHTAYITYTRSEDALRAIHAVNNMVVEGRFLKASLGTTKYCSNFLKGQACHKPECMYLHDVAEEEISFTKEDMHQGKHTEYERRLHEQMGSSGGGGGGFGSGRELAAMRNRAAGGAGAGRKQTDKKRGAGSGSLENLPAIANERSRSGTTPVPMTKGNSINCNTTNHTGNSAGDECSDDLDLGFDPFAADSSKGSIERKQSSDTKSAVGVGSSESLHAMVGEENGRGRTTPGSVMTKGSSSSNNNINNYMGDDGEHDDELGFDPFAESSKALEEIMEEEKNCTPPGPIGSCNSHSRLHNGTICGDGNHSAAKASSHFFSASNNLFGHGSNHLMAAARNGPPPGLHHPTPFAQTQQHHQPQNNAFTSFFPGGTPNNPTAAAAAAAQFHHNHNAQQQQMYNSSNNNNNGNSSGSSNNNFQHPHHQQHQFGGIGTGHNSLGDLRETFRGSAAFNNHHHNQQQQQHFGVGSIGIGHNSLSDLRESFKALLPNVNVRFISDAAANGQLQQQQKQQQQQQQQQRQSNFSGVGDTFFDAVRTAVDDGQPQQQQQQQPPPSWLPVPPGFSPLFSSTTKKSNN